MSRILIVGATGQLGTRIFEKLAEEDSHSLRIFIRKDSQHQHLLASQPEVVYGDLKDKESILPAVEGCDIVITTANAVAPRKKEDTFQKVDISGFMDLIDAAKNAGVKQFIYVSGYPGSARMTSWVPLMHSKATIENYLKNSGVTYTIFQPDTFMDVYFAFAGSTLPAQGEVAAVVNRPFGFMQNFYAGVKDNVANGKFGIIGDGTIRHCYVAIDNVAEIIEKSVENPAMYNQAFLVGGPEALSSLEVKAVFEKVLNKDLSVKKTPAFMMKLMGNVFGFLGNEAASNILKLNYWAATHSTVFDTQKLADKLGVRLITAEEYLRSKVEQSKREEMAKA